MSRLTRERLGPLKGSRGNGAPRSVKRKLIELHEMLHVAPWERFPLTLTYTSDGARYFVHYRAWHTTTNAVKKSCWSLPGRWARSTGGQSTWRARQGRSRSLCRL